MNRGEPTWQTDMPEPQANPGWYWSPPDQGRRTRSQACSPLKWTPYRWSVLTGQTITPNLGKDAFQEADVFGVTMPVVKHSYLVREVNDLPRVMNEAFHLATSGRPGPVLVDLPKDVVSAECEADFTDEFHLPGYAPPARGLTEDLEKAAELISSSKKPLLYVGAGAVIAQASRQVIGLAEKLQAPVTTTLLGKGAFPSPIRFRWACWACMGPPMPIKQSWIVT